MDADSDLAENIGMVVGLGIPLHLFVQVSLRGGVRSCVDQLMLCDPAALDVKKKKIIPC